MLPERVIFLKLNPRWDLGVLLPGIYRNWMKLMINWSCLELVFSSDVILWCEIIILGCEIGRLGCRGEVEALRPARVFKCEFACIGLCNNVLKNKTGPKILLIEWFLWRKGGCLILPHPWGNMRHFWGAISRRGVKLTPTWTHQPVAEGWDYLRSKFQLPPSTPWCV